jgi:hypothetical protein
VQRGSRHPWIAPVATAIAVAAVSGCSLILSFDEPDGGVGPSDGPGASDGGDPGIDAAPDASDLPPADAGPPPIDAAPPADAAPCVGGARTAVDPATGHCYILFTGQLIWGTARDACRGLDPPAELVTISSAEENALVGELAGGQVPWLGANDIDVEDAFEWVSGEFFGYENWDTDEPTLGDDTSDCVLMDPADDRWQDRPCGQQHDRICERL